MKAGQPGGVDKENNMLVANTSKYFTLGGFMIDADEILEIERAMKDIKIKYGLNQYHEVKWHTTYSKIGLNFEQYKSMKETIISFISQYKNSVISIVADKESCYKNKDYINTPNDLYSVALHFLMERYCMEIYKEKKIKKQKPTIMIADSRQSINSNKLDKELKIADFCAGAIHRKYENEDDTFFNKLMPAIRKHKGTIYGPGVKLYK